MSLDGDCVGSELALSWYLASLGKHAVICNSDPVPAKFHFLGRADSIGVCKTPPPLDVLMILDCSNMGRLGWERDLHDEKFIINIDHHRDNSNFGNVNIVDTKASATGELIYRFFAENGISFPPEVAESLYAAIMTDTGGFRFPNTTGRVLRICADLVEKGADPSKVYERIYASHSQRGLLLQARIWSTLAFLLDGKVCCMQLPMSLYAGLGALPSDSEGMADYTITAADVEVGILAKHSENETHFSLRSKGRVDVGKIAQKIPGGGGHSSAAGCTVRRPFPEALDYLLTIIRQEVG